VAEIGEPLDELHQVIAQTQQSIAIVLAAAVVAVALLSFLLASEITNPIDELARAMREIGSDRLNQRLRWKGRPDEIGRLAASFDDLLGRLEEAFARERRFISDASHELKTPLTSIDANAQLLLRWADRDAAIRKESLETIVNESASLAGILSGMLALAKAESGDAVPKEPVSLRALAAQAVAAGAQGAAENGLTLQLESAQDTPIILGDASLLRRLIANLIENAVQFTDRGSVTVRVKTAGEEAVVEVEDTGRGIDSGDLPFIFDRFYRVDKSHSRAVPGTGLGLAIVRSIALMHDGRVEADRSPSGGTIVRAAFPRVTA
jgi:two-component system OmpR family sensor kinase